VEVKMEFVREIPALLSAIGGFIVAIAIAELIRRVGKFFDRYQF